MALPPQYFNPNLGPAAAGPDWVALNNLFGYLSAINQPQDQAPPDMGPQVYYIDSGGGGYEPPPPPPAPPPYDPAKDPAYQNLLAQLGLKETSARTTAAQNIARAQEAAALQKPRIAEQGIEQQRNINLGDEGRGMFRSGERLRQLALQQRTQGERLSDVDRGLANQVAGINQNLDQQVRDLAFQRAQAELQARQTAAQTGLYS